MAKEKTNEPVSSKNGATTYNPVKVESKWSQIWEETKAFKTNLIAAKKPYYNLMMFPYPSGEGLHIGHTYTFGGADTFGRFKKMQGYDVFEPMGFDAFGIHSENYALKKNKHPDELIKETVAYFRDKQLKRFGAIFDWENSVNTTDPDYYKGTQWLFIQLFKAGLAVRKKAKVDWCPSCLTVLAAEQVIKGECERCGTQVVQKELEQWFFKITSYADRLLDNLEKIDWSETTKQMQANWIGRSQGAKVLFKTEAGKELPAFTTRLDTVYGVTFLAIAPEHASLYWQGDIGSARLDPEFVKENLDEVQEYIKQSLQKGDQDRQAQKDKTGVSLGNYAINPANGERVPIYVCDYVLGSYGTGVVMGVPAHDERDYEFAKKEGLEIKQVVDTPKSRTKTNRGEEADPDKSRNESTLPLTSYGKLINSDSFDGLSSEEAKVKILEKLLALNLAEATTNYHLRDWLISRQRYWGPPIPMVYCQACASKGVSYFDKNPRLLREVNSSQASDLAKDSDSMLGWFPVPEEVLPVKLPFVENFKPTGTGKSPLAQDESFVNTPCPNCGESALRETDVSDTFLDSSWYFLKYPSMSLEQEGRLKGSKTPWDTELNQKWLPVDMYIGGNEHAVLHLLYTRFVTMVLNDLGHIDFEEPFKKFRAHGLITYKGMKMSKSRGNVINPNDYFDSYGFDTIKLYLLFVGPYDEGGDWNDRGIIGTYRFIQKVWSLAARKLSIASELAQESLSKRSRVIKELSYDLEHLRFNTAIAKLMEYTNYLTSRENISREEVKTLILLLAPLAPFVSEEIWQQLNGFDVFKPEHSVHNQAWPSFSEAEILSEEPIVVVQLNGKVLTKLNVSQQIADDKDKVIELALSDSKVKARVGEYKQAIYVPGKILNFVV